MNVVFCTRRSYNVCAVVRSSTVRCSERAIIAYCMSTSALGSVGLSANMFVEPRFLLDAFAKRDFGLALLVVSILFVIASWGRHILHDMLVAVGAQLCCAGRHDVVARRDVCWLAPTLSVSNHSLWARGKNVLVLLEPRLKNLAMVLHALDIL